MGFRIEKEALTALREKFPAGSRVELVRMEDPYRRMELGMQGTVRLVDDTGTIHVSWDNGSGLGVVYGEDQCKLVDG